MTNTPTTPTNPDSSPVEIFCMNCGYNLSGSPSDRCSECGSVFDREDLIHWTTMYNRPMALPDAGPRPYWHLFHASLFTPSRIGRQLASKIDPTSASEYVLLMRVLAGIAVPIVFTILLAIITDEGEVILAVLVLPLPILGGGFLCDLVLSALMSKLLVPRSVALPPRGQFCKALCRAFSGHLFVHAVLFLGTVLAIILSQEADLLVQLVRNVAPFLLIGLPVTMIVWWWNNLGRAIVARCEPTGSRTTLLVLIPVVGVLAVGFGIFVYYVEMMVCATNM